jgi:hypothetical protein
MPGEDHLANGLAKVMASGGAKHCGKKSRSKKSGFSNRQAAIKQPWRPAFPDTCGLAAAATQIVASLARRTSPRRLTSPLRSAAVDPEGTLHALTIEILRTIKLELRPRLRLAITHTFKCLQTLAGTFHHIHADYGVARRVVDGFVQASNSSAQELSGFISISLPNRLVGIIFVHARCAKDRKSE